VEFTLKKQKLLVHWECLGVISEVPH
jgi:hypothetical protein